MNHWPSDWIGRKSIKNSEVEDITKCRKCLAYYSRSHAKKFGHRCSELIACLITLKGKKSKSFIDWRKVWRDVTYCGRSYCRTLCVHEKGMIRRAVEKNIMDGKNEKAEG